MLPSSLSPLYFSRKKFAMKEARVGAAKFCHDPVDSPSESPTRDARRDKSRRDAKSRGMRATERIDLSAKLWHGTTTRDNLPRRACRCFRHHHRRRLYNRYSCRVGDGAGRPATRPLLVRRSSGPARLLRGVRKLSPFVSSTSYSRAIRRV